MTEPRIPQPSPFATPGPYAAAPAAPGPYAAAPAAPGPYGAAPAAPGPYAAAPATPVRRGAARTVAAVALVAVCAGGVGGAVGAAAADDDSPGLPSAGSAVQTSFEGGPVAEVAAQVLPSVVSIEVRSSRGAGSGSGVVLDGDGHVLTNNHVVEPGTDGEISVVFSDGRRSAAEVVGLDPVTDLAVLDVADDEDLQPIALGRSSEVRVGDAVIAVGSPLGLSGTVTTGIVSALDRTVRTDPQNPLLGAIQTDAAINPGNSGGALVDASGRLIGINTAISTRGGGSIGLGFAIPVDEARSVADQLIRTGTAEHASLGVAAASVTTDDGRTGVRLQDVATGSPAAEAGLAAGDVVVAVDGDEVKTVDQLVQDLRSHEVGDSVAVTYLRDGRERTAQVVLAAREV